MALRAECAKLLGYKTYAEYSARRDDGEDAGRGARPARSGVAEPARASARGARRAAGPRARRRRQLRDRGMGLALLRREGAPGALRSRRSGDAALPTLDNVIAAAFDSRVAAVRPQASRSCSDAPRYHKDVRVWEVTGERGKHVGMFLRRLFRAALEAVRRLDVELPLAVEARTGRRVRPIIVNVMNFRVARTASRHCCRFDDARTLFHEFGHGLHGLLSDVTYPSISGTSVARDFVELPSQLYEHWLTGAGGAGAVRAPRTRRASRCRRSCWSA